MSRIRIRLRLTLAFAIAMAAVLAATGSFLYFRLGSSLDEAIDDGLEARLADLPTLLVAEGTRGELTGSEDHVAQILDADGTILETTSPPGRTALLDSREVGRVRSEGLLRVERRTIPGIDGDARLLATTARGRTGPRIVVVGSSLGDRDEAQSGLLAQLLIGGPAALLLASLLGYAVARSALRPVESMRAEASEISASVPGRRLPVPAARDEMGRLAVTLNDMLARLETALERERRFVADASHELRTPLALLKTELELALRRPRPAEELEDALRSAAAETDRLARLAENLLVLTRSDEGRLTVHRGPVQAGTLLAAVAERFATEAGEAGRAVRLDGQGSIRLSADAPVLEQAIGNLVANALAHGRGTVSLSALERNGTVELHVTDEGPGFTPAFLPRAFERFSRADEARSGAGAGLGLAIAEVIARAHGGAAHISNRDGGGADVWLSIPA